MSDATLNADDAFRMGHPAFRMGHPEKCPAFRVVRRDEAI